MVAIVTAYPRLKLLSSAHIGMEAMRVLIQILQTSEPTFSSEVVDVSDDTFTQATGRALWDSSDLTRSIDNFSEHFIRPAMEELADKVYGSAIKCANLPLYTYIDVCELVRTNTQPCLSMRMIRAYDITKDQWPSRFDLLYKSL